MLKILRLLKNFFQTLISGNTEEAKKQKDLKKILKQIKQHKPVFYKQTTGQVLSQFAQTVFNFVQYLKPLKELIYKTLLHENNRLAEMYKDYLVEVRLGEETKFKKQDFSYDKIRTRLLNTASLKTETEILVKEFAEFFNYFSGPDFANFDADFGALELFTSACRHDFFRLLMYFDPDISIPDNNYKPRFSPCIGHHANQELMDLYFVLADLNLSMGLEKNLLFLLSRLKKEVTEIDEIKIKKIITTLDNIHKTYLSPEILLLLLRAINGDPYLTVKTEKSTKTYLDVYRGKLSSRFQADLEKVTRESNERDILQDLGNLFGQAELLEIEGYGEGLAKMLQAESFNSFSYIKPLRILKSFTVFHFEKKIKETVNKIIINSFFEKKEFKDRFINLFHATQNTSEAIMQFENTFSASGEVSISRIRKYLVEYKNGKPVGYALNKLIETTNNMALKVIEDYTNIYYSFQEVLLEIIHDARQHIPILISNIKVIGGDKNQEIIANLLDAHKKLSIFTEIMKNFTIIRPRIEKDQLQEPPKEMGETG